MSSILLKTKLHVPQIRMTRVKRPALVSRLQQSMDKRLILVSAPAGYGKTTLLTEWLSTVNHPTAWISLDKGDNDIGTFWLYLIHALQLALQTVGAQLNHDLTSELTPSNDLMFESCLVDVINELDQINQSVIFVLDDYQAIRSQEIHQGITFLINHAPACFHLVIVTRADPPLNLAHLRGSSQLAEFRLADLRFSTQEIMEFMQTVMQVVLSESEVLALAETTEGWIAGLQLAGLSLQGRENVSDFINTFSGEDRYIMDFLFEEVLSLQPEHIQDFLLKTSILRRLSFSLCNAVTQSEDSQEILNFLYKHNLFLISVDEHRQWYRYHHLFRDLLRNRLHQITTIDPILLHQRASYWYEEEGELEIAISHALDAHDFDHLANLLEKTSKSIDLQNQQLLFTTWLEMVPVEVMSQHPWLCVFRAWGAYWTGHRGSDHEPWLLLAENALENDDDLEQKQKILGYIAVIKAHIALAHREIHQVLELGQKALGLLPETDPMRCEATIALAGAYWALGDVIQTKRMFLLTRENAMRLDYHSMAAGSSVYLGIQQVKQGALNDAIVTFKEGLKLATKSDGRETPMVGIAYCRLGDVWREQNKLEAAFDCLERGLRQCQILGQPDFMMDAYVCSARYHLAMGDLDAALDILDKADRVTRHTMVDPWIHCWLDDCRLRAWTCAKNLEAINLWEQNAGLSLDDPLDYHNDLHHQNLARILVVRYAYQNSEKDYAKANVLLNRLQIAAKFAGWIHEEIRILVLRAILCNCGGFPEVASQKLLQAVVLAQPGEYLRVFLDEGDLLRGLFKHLGALSDTELSDSLGRIMSEVTGQTLEKIKQDIVKINAAFYQPIAEVLVDQEYGVTPPHFVIDAANQLSGEKLTPREKDVLSLLARGFPDKRIAETLVITRETVHKHLKNIYQKLNVHSRMEAVIRAQALGLLSDQS